MSSIRDPRAADRTAIRLAATLSASILALAAVPATAQEQTAQAPETAETLGEAETIVVTGSRLARDVNAVAPVPISTLGAADLRAAGNTDTAATLRQLPALVSSGTVADSLERGAGGVGQATLNLRQLGSARTLVLVDSRRHVSGVAGNQIVDIATIPNALIERVEVLTGGASAIYGADAVTGVVNFVLKQDFEGIEIDAQTGISSRGDGHSFTVNGTWGKNFNEGRGNVTISAGYTNEQEILLGDRSFTANNGRANNSTTYQHPDRRFQKGDISSASTPNFANYYRIGGPGGSDTRFPFGPVIPTAAQAAALFPGGLTAAEQALIDRAANSPLFRIGADPRFAISSNAGVIYRADFDFFGLDVNNNGTPDCNESFIGRVVFGGGGCYISTPGGGVKVFEDGLISNNTNQFGGDGAIERTNATSLTPRSERIYAAFRGQYEFSAAAEVFIDAKYSRTDTLSRNSYNTFFDTIYIAPDNPYIPAVLQADADEAGGLLISRDNTDLGAGISRAYRDTYRIVGGIRGEITPALRYDFAVNYGRTDNTVTFDNFVLADRYAAATDAVRLPDGRIVCRSDIDPTATPQGFVFPSTEGGFFTFRPGDGQCRPISLFNGADSISAEGVGFITRPATDRFRLEQFVATLAFYGDTGSFLNLPGGAVSYAFGLEYRKEKSRSTFSNEDLGILDDGTFIGDISSNVNLGLTDQVRIFNAGGEFDVKEIFGELRLPILKDRPFFHELSVEGAARYADYSTSGGAFTWNVAGTWAPVTDIRFRGSYSKAIRAPNIAELFNPAQAGTFRPNDPCVPSSIAGLKAADPGKGAIREANCLAAITAAGIPNAAAFLATYADNLSGRFPGTNSGNPNLDPEEATTWTVGGVFQPSFLRGFTASVDYYSIRIDDAIAQPEAQLIVDNCYDLEGFPNQFCALFDRKGPGNGDQTFNFDFLRRQNLNIARLETSGIDATIGYAFRLGEHRFNLRGTVNWVEKLDRYFDPANPNDVDPGLRETSAPEWAGLGSITWGTGGFDLTWRTQYIGRQAVASAIQVERIDVEFGPDGWADPYWVHDVSASFKWTEGFEIYGGINNLTDKQPFIASSAYPVSGIGRFFFLGMRARF